MTSVPFAKKRLTTFLLILAAIVLCGSVLFPLWQIELYAPQYPEGLILLIHANKLGGNVDIINGLNHYIGMHVLEEKNFPEFRFLPYIMIGWSVCIFIVALLGKRKWLNVLMVAFVVFSLVAMADFYRWNYNYGHDLDPNAAIKVPGMSYQPPIIGYKQLLNFGAYAMPATGGWCYIASAILILIAFIMENKWLKFLSRKKKATPVVTALVVMMGMSCSGQQPRAARLNEDECAQCRMTITDNRYVTQIVSKKGRQYLFDDITCMVLFRKDHPEIMIHKFYAADFCAPHAFLPVDEASFVASDSLRSPMGGNIASFSVMDSARYYQQKFAARQLTWAEINK